MRFLLVFTTIFTVLNVESTEWEKIYKDVSPSIPLIAAQGRGICSGALIEKDKILTAAHCVSNLRKVFISWSDNLTVDIEAKVIALDLRNDLAVVSIPPQETKKTIPIIGDIKNVTVGQEVATIGHPFAISQQKPEILLDQTYVLSRGIISKINDNNIMTDASVSPGNSGGPVLNRNGEIIGILSRKNVAFGSGDNATLTTTQQVNKLVEYSNSKERKLIRWFHAQSVGYSVLSISTYSFLKDRNSSSLEFVGIGFRIDFADRIPISAHATFENDNNSFLKFNVGYKFAFFFEKFLPISFSPVVGVLSHRSEVGESTKKRDALTYGVLFDVFNLSIDISSYRLSGRSESTASFMINFRWGQ